MREVVIGGLYRHFKGHLYRVSAVARHSETLEELVIYTDDTGNTWARPKGMFLGIAEQGEKAIPRFRLEREEA